MVGPSDNLSLVSIFRNVAQGSTPTFTNGVVFAWEPDGETGDDPHVRLHAPYTDGNIYFDSGPLSTGRLAAAAPTNFSNNWQPFLAQRTSDTALVAWDNPWNTIGTASALSGAIDTSKKGYLKLMQGIPGAIGEMIVIPGAINNTDALGTYLEGKWTFNED